MKKIMIALLITAVLCSSLIPSAFATTINAPINADSSAWHLVDDAYKDAYAAEILRLVNDLRTSESLSILAYGSTTQEAVDYRSYELSVKYGHARPNGGSILNLQEECGSDEHFTIENITKMAYEIKTDDGETYIMISATELAAQAFSHWQESSGHYTSMMRGNSTRMVVGLYIDDGYACSAQWFSSK